jgi:hypothetical protein
MNRSVKVLLALAGLGGAALAARAATLYALGKGVEFVGEFEGAVQGSRPLVIDDIAALDLRDRLLTGYPSSN